MVIKSAEFVISNSRVEKCPTTGLPEYAFIGRSNVGKSSLINMLTARKGLAMTSQKPGKTQLINHFIINDAWYLVDLPGYGYARLGKDSRDSLRRRSRTTYWSARSWYCSSCSWTADTSPRRSTSSSSNGWVRKASPFALVFTKADKLSKGRLAANVEAYKTKLHEEWGGAPPDLRHLLGGAYGA